MQLTKKQSGFTLIEIIIVVVIIGVMASMVTISLGDKKQELLETEAKRFQALVTLASQEAILQSRHLAIGFFQGGYQFYQENDVLVDDIASDGLKAQKTRWKSLDQDSMLRRRELPTKITAQLYLSDTSIVLAQEKGSEKSEFAEKQVKPQIFLLSSGENTPFEYQLEYTGTGLASLKVDPIGNIKIEYKYTDND